MALQNQLLQKKKALLLKLYNTYESFEHTADTAINILSDVEITISEIHDLDVQLSEEEVADFSENHRDVWLEIIHKHKELLEFLEKENKTVKNQMRQVNKKNQMINGYMDQNGSIFLDRQA